MRLVYSATRAYYWHLSLWFLQFSLPAIGLYYRPKFANPAKTDKAARSHQDFKIIVPKKTKTTGIGFSHAPSCRSMGMWKACFEFVDLCGWAFGPAGSQKLQPTKRCLHTFGCFHQNCWLRGHTQKTGDTFFRIPFGQQKQFCPSCEAKEKIGMGRRDMKQGVAIRIS